MSVINQMLKDLAKRSNSSPGPEIILLDLVATKYKRYRRKRFYFILLSVVCILAFLEINSYTMLTTPETHKSKELISPVIKPFSLTNINISPTTPVVETRTPKLLSPHIITGISLEPEKEMTRFRFLLDKTVIYRIMSYNKDELTILLENTQLSAALPAVNETDNAIKMLAVESQMNGDLKIIFHFNPGTELVGLNIMEENQLPELQIDFFNKETNDKVNDNSDEIIKENKSSSVKKISYGSVVEDEYRQTTLLYNQGKINEAINELSVFIEKYPNYIPAHQLLTTLLIKKGSFSEAHRAINAGLEKEPLYPPYIQLKAQVFASENKVPQALKLLQTITPSLEENQDYYAFMAALYQKQNQFSLSEKIYEQLVIIQPSNSIWWIGLGIAKENLNKPNEAIAAYRKAYNDNLKPELKVFIENRIHELV